MPARNWSTYVLIDPISAQIRYVGKTLGPISKRLREHIAERGPGGDLARWIDDLHKRRLAPIAVVVALYDRRDVTLIDLVESGADMLNGRGVPMSRQISMLERAYGPFRHREREAFRLAHNFIPRTSASLAASPAVPV